MRVNVRVGERRRTIVKRKTATTVLFLIAFIFSACAPIPKDGGYEHPDFETEYTLEEHMSRIATRTEEKFAEEIVNGEIVNYEVEIVYAFYDHDPEYFLVELEYAKEFEWNYPKADGGFATCLTKYKHLIGYIIEDRYCVGLQDYDEGDGFIGGRSSYELCGFSNSKKYYERLTHGVETPEGFYKFSALHTSWEQTQ